jgi:HSP20 family molecular chaperone IbpA
MTENQHPAVTDRGAPVADSSLPPLLPPVDIYSTDQEIVAFIDLPGVRREDVTIDMDSDQLVISAAMDTLQGESERPLFGEIEKGRFQRRFELNDAIDRDSVDARFELGVLRLRLPLVEKQAPKRIEVKGK